MNNLHITLGTSKFASRILKETSSLVRSGLVEHVYIAALHEDGLDENEKIDDNRDIWRARLGSRKWSHGLVVQLVKYLEFCVRVFFYARTKNIKLVNIHSVALLPLGVFFKWLFRANLVYDAHELETETYGLSGFRQTISRYVERMFIKDVDFVIVVGDAINDWYRVKYSLTNIVTVLNCPEFQETKRTRRLHHEIGIPEDRKIVIYQGGLARGRGIELLLKAFADYNDDKFVLVLMGYGELEPLIREYADSYSNIYLKKAVEPAVVLLYTASADVGISYIDNPCLNDYFCLPNKLFEYIMAALPVIVNNIPEQRRVVTEKQIGIALDELTPQSLSRALDELYLVEPGVLSKNLRRSASIYSWQNQERVMINAYKEFVWSGLAKLDSDVRGKVVR